MLFFFFLVVVSNFLVIPAVRGKIRVKIALAIPRGALTTLINEQIDNPPVVEIIS